MMRRLMLVPILVVLLAANLGCFAVVSNETLEASTRRVAVSDGDIYVIDLEHYTARKVKLVDGEAPVTEISVTDAVESESTLTDVRP